VRRLLALTLLLVLAACGAAEDEMLPGTPGTIVIPEDESHGGSGAAGPVTEGVFFGGRFGGFLPFSQNNYLGFDSLAWRFEALINLEAGDWKAVGSVGLYTATVEDPPDYVDEPSFWALPVGLGVYYQFGERFSPYAGGGVGFTVFHVSGREHVEDGFQREFTELLFTPHLAAGLDLFRDENFRVNVEARLELAWSEEQSQIGGFSFLAGLAF
jgi:opacity protein-like surface antigen